MQPGARFWTVPKYLSVLLVAATVVGTVPHQQPSSFSVGPLASLSVSSAAQAEPQPQQDVRPPHAKIKHVLKHSYDVFSVAFSPDGKQVAAGGILGARISIWDVETGQLVRELIGPSGTVQAIAYSPDGKYLASGRGFVNTTKDKISIYVWDTKSWELVHKLTRPPSESSGSNEVKSLAFSPDSKHLAVAFDLAKLIAIYDVSSGEPKKQIPSATFITSTIVYSPEERFLAFGRSGKFDFDARRRQSTIEIWDVTRGKIVKTFKAHSGRVESLAYSPNGKFLVSGSDTGVEEGILNQKTGEFIRTRNNDPIKVWDSKTGELTKTLSGHSGSVKSVAYRPDGKYLASGSQDKTIRLWNAVTGELMETLNGHADLINSVAFSPNGEFLASGGGKVVKIWKIELK